MFLTNQLIRLRFSSFSCFSVHTLVCPETLAFFGTVLFFQCARRSMAAYLYYQTYPYLSITFFIFFILFFRIQPIAFFAIQIPFPHSRKNSSSGWFYDYLNPVGRRHPFESNLQYFCLSFIELLLGYGSGLPQLRQFPQPCRKGTGHFLAFLRCRHVAL